MHKTKFVPKGIAKTLGTLCEKFEAAKRAPKRKSAKKSAKRKTKRDPAYGTKRKIKRRTAKSAVGSWAFRDSAYGPAKKRKAPKKRKAAKKRTARRDWPGHPILHARAAKLGVKRKKALGAKAASVQIGA